MSADQDGDGQIDQWTYLDGNRPLRGESDGNGDGRIDRWEYFDVNGKLTHAGTASLNDGIEDTWTYVPDANGDTRVAHARARDRHVDRYEFVRGETLLRVEEDTNADGRIDRWDRYEGAVLREVAFDLTHTRGRATRRVLYNAAGRFEAIEDDPEGDGTFVRLSDEAAAAAKTGVQRR